MNNSKKAANHIDFVSVLDKLLESQFLLDKSYDGEKITVTESEIKRATWLASIAALSNGDQEKNLANSFGALLYLSDPENEVYRRACYILQSRSGNLITSAHIPKIFNKETNAHLGDYGTLLNFELAANRAILQHTFSDETEIFFTKFQKGLWESLIDRKNVAISAPTSAGKSHIIKKYIYELVGTASRTIFFIVPTKALINQVSNNLKFDLKDKAHVLTTYIPIDFDGDKSIIYVLTPERCLKFLQDTKSVKKPDLVFVDEVHNVEEPSRGAKFENVIYRLINKFPLTQFVMAGPFIDNLSESLKKICNIDFVDHKTLSTPVFQIKAALTFYPKEKAAKYRIASPTGNILDGSIKLKKSLYSKVKSNKGDALEIIADLFPHDDNNIYYAPKKSSAEKWASKIAPLIASKNPKIVDGADERIKDLISFLEEEVHPNYSLIRNLRLGVAYHHAGLPDIARQEVEELYINSSIRNIVCTSTLLQGVNLPADRLIVISPKVNNNEMTDFSFLNLIGRAGRANTKLFGEIYCIDVKEDEWAEDKLTKEKSKTVESSTSLFLRKSENQLAKMASLSRGEIRDLTDDGSVYENISYMRSIYHTDIEHFNRLLGSSGISASSAKDFSDELKRIYDEMVIPVELISKNPFIDPFLQNKLFLNIREKGVFNWMITRFPVSKDGIDDSSIDISEQSYYQQFKTVFLKLDQIFEIESEMNGANFNSNYIGIKKLVMDSHNWMKGKKHRFFIDKQIGCDITDENEIDKAARYITSHISKNVTFIGVKYLMLWSDMVSYFLTEEDLDKYSYILNLPSMLEMGSYDPTTLELMSYGINRSVALDISKKIKKMDIPVEQALSKINKNELSGLFNRHLVKAGY